MKRPATYVNDVNLKITTVYKNMKCVDLKTKTFIYPRN